MTKLTKLKLYVDFKGKALIRSRNSFKSEIRSSMRIQILRLYYNLYVIKLAEMDRTSRKNKVKWNVIYYNYIICTLHYTYKREKK